MHIRNNHAINRSMKELLAAIGKLVVLKRINRQTLETSVGMCRTNMAASFHGKRPFPEKSLPKLRAALLLDKDYRFDRDHVHAIWPRVGKNKPGEVLAVISHFTKIPLTARYRVNVIGELGTEAVALVLEDSRNALVFLQHDEDNFLNEFEILISGRADSNYEKVEVHTNDYHAITTDQKTPKQVLEMFSNPGYVWTWQRLRTIAMNKGISPNDAAQLLNIRTDEIC